MILTFQGRGDNFVRLDIDRTKKKLIVTSSLTNYQPRETEWWKLFDPGKEEEQEKIFEKLNDHDFVRAFEEAMKKIGYELIKVE